MGTRYEYPNGKLIEQLSPELLEEYFAKFKINENRDSQNVSIHSLIDAIKPIDEILYAELFNAVYKGERIKGKKTVGLMKFNELRAVRHSKIKTKNPLFYLATDTHSAAFISVLDSIYTLRNPSEAMYNSHYELFYPHIDTQFLYETTCRTEYGEVILSQDTSRSQVGFLNFQTDIVKDPVNALYEAGFDLSPSFSGEAMIQTNGIYRISALTDHVPINLILTSYLLALWEDGPKQSKRKRVIFLLSIDDDPTIESMSSLIKHKEEMEIVSIYVLSQYGSITVPSSDEIFKRLVAALGDADPAETLLAVHQGIAFTRAENSIVSAVKSFSEKYPDIQKGLDVRVGLGAGKELGVYFEQPQELDDIFEYID